MSQAEILASLPAPLHKHLDPQGPLPPRMMAAKGMVPFPPKDLVPLLAGLVLDADASLVDAARASLTKMPDKLLGPVIDAGLAPAVLGVLATELLGREDLLEKVVTNRHTPDLALVAMADKAPAKIVEILAENQERCMRCEPLVRAVKSNPNLLKSMSTASSTSSRAPVFFRDMPEFSAALARLSPAEMAQTADKIALPEDVAALLAEDPAPTNMSAAALAGQLAAEQHAAPVDAADSPEGEEKAEQEEVKPERISTLKLINGLNPAQKVALAMKGNKEARSILMRDANRSVAVAAIKNPRITEQEVMGAAKSRQINDEVIRIICASKEMSRSYGVKLALVNNPKTPMQIAQRYLTMLTQGDLRAVAKSKSIPNALSLAAKKLLMAKQSGG